MVASSGREVSWVVFTGVPIQGIACSGSLVYTGGHDG